MPPLESMEKLLKTLTAPQRNVYYYGKLMGVANFQMEQDYLNSKRWMLNRLALGTGVLCGLKVSAQNNQICITRGVGIDPLGREIILPHAVCLDPWQIAESCDNSTETLSHDQSHTITIGLCYTECAADAQPVLVADCNANNLCEPSTMIEGYRFEVCEEILIPDTEYDPNKKPASVPVDYCKPLFGDPNSDENTTKTQYRVVATIHTDGSPSAVAIHPKASRAVVISEETPGRAWVIDISSNQIVHTFTDLPGTPQALAVAKDGGPVFVTSDSGVTLLDVESTPPQVMRSILPDNSYAACAAGFAGSILFTINNGSAHVDRIELGTDQVTAEIEVGKAPSLVAISPDEQVLIVYDPPEATAFALDTSSNQVMASTPFNVNVKSMAVRLESEGWDAFLAEPNMITSFNGRTALVSTSVNFEARAIAFTTDGTRFYCLNNNADTNLNEIIIFDAGVPLSKPMTEIARLKVDPDPVSVAIIPDGLRALVAHRTGGSISVVDMSSDRRKAMCEAALGDCSVPEGDICITLARVQLLEDGTIGELETCIAPVVYSNVALFEMILCLADRIDQCCNTITVNQPPIDIGVPWPQEQPLQVSSVDFINANGELLRSYVPGDELSFKVRDQLTTLRVQFANQKLDPNSVTAGSFGDDPDKFTFLVQGSNEALQKFVPGKVEVTDDSIAVFTIDPQLKAFDKGEYVLTLFGTPNNAGATINDQRGFPLDGETGALPSGDGAPGGNFSINFVIKTR